MPVPVAVRPGKLTDDRGAAVAPHALRADHTLGGKRDPQLADLRLRAYLSVSRKRKWWYVALYMLACGIVGGLVPTLLPRYLPGLPVWIAPALVIVPIVIVVSWRTRYALARRGSAAADLFLREGRCPGCAYVLDGVPEESDGCRVCPECGAAWKHARIGSSSDQSSALREYRRRVYQPTGREKWIPGFRALLVAIDDRGNAANVSNPRLRGLDHDTSARIGPRRIGALRKATGWNHRARGVLFVLLFLPGLLMFARILLRPPQTASFTSTLISLAMFIAALMMVLFMLGFIVSMLFGDAGLSAKHVARAFVAQGVCPQCLSDLPDSAAEDGASVCNCGAAWKREA